MKFEINFRADLTPEQKKLLDLHFENILKHMGIQPEALTITLREKPDFIPAAWPATFTGGGAEMKIKFRTFRPVWEYRGNCNVCINPEVQINDWLKENPDIEIIHWQACSVGDHDELYITIQYREPEDKK